MIKIKLYISLLIFIYLILILIQKNIKLLQSSVYQLTDDLNIIKTIA